MRGKKSLALCERHRMRGDGANITECCSGTRDKVHFDRQDGFRGDRKITFEKQVVHAHDGARQRIFHRHQEYVGRALGNGPECRVKRWTRNRRDFLP